MVKKSFLIKSLEDLFEALVEEDQLDPGRPALIQMQAREAIELIMLFKGIEIENDDDAQN